MICKGIKMIIHYSINDKISVIMVILRDNGSLISERALLSNTCCYGKYNYCSGNKEFVTFV